MRFMTVFISLIDQCAGPGQSLRESDLDFLQESFVLTNE